MDVSEQIHPDERTLVHEALRGRRSAFEELCHRHTPVLWRFAHAVAASPAQASPPAPVVADAVGDGITRAMLAVEQAGGQTAPISFRVLALAAVLDGEPDSRPGSRCALTLDEDVAATLTAFARLPLQWRAALWLVDVEGLPPAPSAAVLRVDPNAVLNLVDQARNGLADEASPVVLGRAVNPMPTGVIDDAWQLWQEARSAPPDELAELTDPLLHPTPVCLEQPVEGTATATLSGGGRGETTRSAVGGLRSGSAAAQWLQRRYGPGRDW